jgi:hypothetical protein
LAIRKVANPKRLKDPALRKLVLDYLPKANWRNIGYLRGVINVERRRGTEDVDLLVRIYEDLKNGISKHEVDVPVSSDIEPPD